MKATKGNKVYTITEDQKKFYIDGGFDILDDEGTVIAYGKGKTVPYAEYAAVKKENAILKSDLEKLKETKKEAASPEEEPEKEPQKAATKKSGGGK